MWKINKTKSETFKNIIKVDVMSLNSSKGKYSDQDNDLTNSIKF